MGAVSQHHRMEAPYLCLFDPVGKGLCLLHRDLKMLFSGFPLMCPSRGEAGDSLRVARYRPGYDCSSVDQLAHHRVKLSGLRMLSEHEKALDNRPEHPP